MGKKIKFAFWCFFILTFNSAEFEVNCIFILPKLNSD